MNVLLVGGAGYIGSQVVRDILREKKCKPVVLDNLSTGHTASLPASVPLVRGSYGNRNLVVKILKQYKIESVLHFGARSLVGESLQKPKEYWKANVEDSLYFLEAMQEVGVKHILLSSTAAVYGRPQHNIITEQHPTKPISPYGKTKLVLENQIALFAQKHGFYGVSLRFFNVAGADDSGRIGEDHSPETHLIPNVLRHAAGKTPFISLWGKNYPTPDGTCIRDYVDVRDVSRAYVMLLRNRTKSGKTWATYNLGSGQGHSNGQVIQTACEVTGKPLTVHMMPRRTGDPAKLVASVAKIKRDFGWQPEYTLEDMIRSAWKWHNTHPDGYN